MFFLSLCVGCFRSHTVLCVLGKHSGGHTCIVCVVMVAPPLHSASFCFLSLPPPFYSTTPLFPLSLLFNSSLPIHCLLFNSSPSCHSPPHINPSTTHFSSYSFLSLHPPSLPPLLPSGSKSQRWQFCLESSSLWRWLSTVCFSSLTHSKFASSDQW